LYTKWFEKAEAAFNFFKSQTWTMVSAKPMMTSFI
jgi:hypothetical protein